MKSLLLSELLPGGLVGAARSRARAEQGYSRRMRQRTLHSREHPQHVALVLLLSLSSPFLLACCRELNVEPLKIFLLRSIFCISCNRYYNDSVHLLKIYEFRLLLVITNSCYTQVVINMSDVQLKSLLFFLTSLVLCSIRIIESGHWGSVCGPGQAPGACHDAAGAAGSCSMPG